MAEILLIQAPYTHLYAGKKTFKKYFPLGLGYLASYLMKNGYKVTLLVEPSEDEICRYVRGIEDGLKPRMVGISCMTSSFPNAVRIAQKIKRESDAVVVLGGNHPSVLGNEILREIESVDYIIYGEGELTILELYRHLLNGDKSCNGIRGLIWRDNGEIIKNPPRELIGNLDEVPFPARDIVDMRDFSTHTYIGVTGRSATMITSRGCPFSCKFCSSHFTMGKRFRTHSVDYVYAEIEELVKRYSISGIFFEDDYFTLQKERVHQICERIIRDNLQFSWACLSRTDALDSDMVRLMKRAGCHAVVFGIESGTDKVLKEVNKKVSLEDAKRVIALCRKEGLKTSASFIIGFPSETDEDMEKTYRFAEELSPTIAFFSCLVPYPGTPYYEVLETKPARLDEWERFVTIGPGYSMVKGLSPKELGRRALRYHLKFYLRPSQIYRILSASSFSELFQYLKSGIYTIKRLIRR